MSVLTQRMVLQKTKQDDLLSVKNLNLWGSSLEDVSIFGQMPNVVVLSLSVNKITSLADFVNCKQLTELYLRKNEVGSLEEVKHLASLPKLKILWLCDNPCATHHMYRQYVIRTLPQLEKLDNIDVTQEERNECLSLPESEFEMVPRRAPAPEPPTQAAPSARSTPSAHKRDGLDRSQRNVVTAVLALLNELTPSSLELIQQDISTRLAT